MNRILFSLAIALSMACGVSLADKDTQQSFAESTKGSVEKNRPIAETFPDCDRFECKGQPHQGVEPSFRAPTPMPDIIAPPAAQRLLYRQPSYPNCSSTTGLNVNGATFSDPAVSIMASSIDIPLGTTALGLRSNHMNVLRGDSTQTTNDGGTHGVFSRILVRETGTSTWTMAAVVQSSVNNSASPQFVVSSMNTLIDLETLGDPSQIDVQVVHLPTGSSGSFGFPSETRRVCLSELEISL